MSVYHNVPYWPTEENSETVRLSHEKGSQRQHDEHVEALQHAWNAAIDHHKAGCHSECDESLARAEEHFGKARALHKKTVGGKSYRGGEFIPKAVKALAGNYPDDTGAAMRDTLG